MGPVAPSSHVWLNQEVLHPQQSLLVKAASYTRLYKFGQIAPLSDAKKLEHMKECNIAAHFVGHSRSRNSTKAFMVNHSMSRKPTKAFMAHCETNAGSS